MKDPEKEVASEEATEVAKDAVAIDRMALSLFDLLSVIDPTLTNSVPLIFSNKKMRFPSLRYRVSTLLRTLLVMQPSLLLTLTTTKVSAHLTLPNPMDRRTKKWLSQQTRCR